MSKPLNEANNVCSRAIWFQSVELTIKEAESCIMPIYLPSEKAFVLQPRPKQQDHSHVLIPMKECDCFLCQIPCEYIVPGIISNESNILPSVVLK